MLYVESREMVPMNLFPGEEYRPRTADYRVEGERVGQIERVVLETDGPTCV